MQDDGNLVLAARGEAIWSTSTNGQDVVRAEVQTDGNFMLYTSDKPMWDTETMNKEDVKLVLQDDRNLVLYAADGPAWSSDTQTDAPRPPLPSAGAAGPAPQGDSRRCRKASPDTRTRIRTAAPCPRAVNTDLHRRLRRHPVGHRRTVLRRRQYQQIADASGVSDPDLIHPGQVLTIP